MTDKAQAALELCRTKALAYIGTVDPDGQPQVTPGVGRRARGEAGVQHRARPCEGAQPRAGSEGHAGDRRPRQPPAIRRGAGRATLTEDGADQFIDDLAKKYLGVDSYPYRTPDERRVTVLVEPDKYLGLPG